MAVTPNNIVTPQGLKTAYQVVDTANTDLDDAPSANVKLLLTAGANGSIVYGLTALPRATPSGATRLGLYLSKDAGTTQRLIRYVVMSAGTVSTAAGPAASDFGFSETVPLRLEASDRIYVDIGVTLSAGVVFHAQYEDL
jgi:hypothetical protein